MIKSNNLSRAEQYKAARKLDLHILSRIIRIVLHYPVRVTIALVATIVANVDSYSEMKIQKALNILLQGRTAIVIAHRLATIRECDRILVLHHGRMVEEGVHDVLIALDGLYAGLYRMNYASFDDLPSEV